MFGMGVPELIVILFIIVLIVLPFWKILTKAGYPGWWSISQITPIGIIVLFYLAFSKWPIQKKLEELKRN